MTDISQSGSKVRLTYSNGESIYTDPSAFYFDIKSNGDFLYRLPGQPDLVIPFSELTISGVAPANIAAEKAAIEAVFPDGGSGGAVSSVFGRTGAVAADAGDYSAFYIPLQGEAALTDNLLIIGGGFFFGATTTGDNGTGFMNAGSESSGTNIGWGSADETQSSIISFGADAVFETVGTGTIKYGADYSANYSARSLIDKGYADGHYMASTANFAWNSETNKLTIQSGPLDTGLLLQATSSSNYSPKLTFNTTTFNLAASIWADYNGDLMLKAEFGQYVKYGSSASGYNVSINAYNSGSNAAPNNYTILALAPDAAAVPLMLRGATSQTGNLQEWQSVAPAVLASVNSKGRFTFIVPTTAASSFNLPAGAAPSSPVDGDVWREDNTNTGVKIRINGTTKTVTVS